MRLARKKDRRTSKQAVPETAKRLRAIDIVVKMAELHPRSTANELAYFASAAFTGTLQETYRKRTAEAVAQGLLVECGEKMCSLTGHSATVSV